jgi:hypothetical protein
MSVSVSQTKPETETNIFYFRILFHFESFGTKLYHTFVFLTHGLQTDQGRIFSLSSSLILKLIVVLHSYQLLPQ